MDRRNTTKQAADEVAPWRSSSWKLLVKALVFAALALAVFLAVRKMFAEWERTGESFADLSIRWGWIGVATSSYAAGQMLFAWFWHQLVRELGGRPGPARTLWAYTAGTLGKYIPGKAGVVLLRTALVSPDRDRRVATGLIAVYEVFTALAVGAIAAGVLLALSLPGVWVWWSCAFAMGFAFAIGLHPSVFGRVAKVASLTFRNQQRGDLRRWSLAWRRWGVLQVAGWLGTGFSFVAVGLALDLPVWSVVDACAFGGAIALATVIGFVFVFVPSGLVVREMVVVGVLAASFGHNEVLIASCVMRMVSIAGELFSAAMALAATCVAASPVLTPPDGDCDVELDAGTDG